MTTRLALWLCLAAALAGAARPWEPYEIELTASRIYQNAYVEGLPASGAPRVVATFTARSGPAEGQTVAVAGFWDGGATWRVRFAPPAPGLWSYRSVSPDPGLDGAAGEIAVDAWSDAEKLSNPTRRGPIRVAASGPRAGRYFEYSDGTPFLWIGDTWWNWGKKGIRFESFQKLADDRAVKGFTIGQLYLAGNGGLLDRTYSVPDLDQLRHIERFITYANSKGITVWIHPWWSRKGLNETVGAEKFLRWWRYVIHRFGAFSVIWVLAGEYNMNAYGGFGLDFWREVGAMVRATDPYRRLIGAHPTPPLWQGGADAPQWSTGEVLHAEPWLDYNQSQPGHGKSRNEMIPLIVAADYARRPPKPIVVTEPWYEFIRGNPPAADVRFGAWSAVLSGAAGHSYGGGHVWWAHVPESPSKQGAWPLEESFDVNTLDYPGAVGLGFLSRFLQANRWWALEPHPELVRDYPAPFCAAELGRQYVVYARWGGGLKLDLTHATEADAFEFTWIDLGAGVTRTQGRVRGGAVREFQAPDGYPSHPEVKDWLLHVRTAQPAP